MAFTLNDLEEMMRLLQENPEKREALRLILLGEELLRLPEKFAQLVAVVERLVEVVQRIEARLERLEQSDERTQARLDQIDNRLERLEQSDERTQTRLDRLEQTQQQMLVQIETNTRDIAEVKQVQQQMIQEMREMRQYVERIANAYGLTLEEEAQDALEYLAHLKGWRFIKEPHPLRSDLEVDILAICEDAQGQTFTVVVEVKARLARRTVREWANRVRAEGFRQRLAEMGYPAPYLVYMMGFRVDPQTEETARELGVGLYNSRGERLEPAPILQ